MIKSQFCKMLTLSYPVEFTILLVSALNCQMVFLAALIYGVSLLMDRSENRCAVAVADKHATATISESSIPTMARLLQKEKFHLHHSDYRQ